MKRLRNRLFHGAVYGACGLVLAAASIAAPPTARSDGVNRAPPRLDLRAPALLGSSGAAPASAPLTSFGTARTQRTPPGASDRDQLPALGADALPVAGAPAARTMGRAEEFARRVHREGLPLARLWENQSTLVSLGLSPRGKPGLWLIQKVR